MLSLATHKCADMDRLISSFFLLILPACECQVFLWYELFHPHYILTLSSVLFSSQMSCPRLLWKSLALGYCSPPRPSVWLALSLGFPWALMVWLSTGFVSPQGRVWSDWQWDDDKRYNPSLKNRLTISKNTSNNQVFLKLASVDTSDTATYYCARRAHWHSLSFQLYNILGWFSTLFLPIVS